jgi:hypothetical protein
MKHIKHYININNGVKVVLSFFLVLFTFHFSPFTSFAYAAPQTLRVSPVIINVSLSPGKTYSNEVTIENLTNSPLPLRATLNDFMTSSEEGGYIFENTKNNPILSWIKLSDTDFLLNPKEKKTIQMTITTPSKIPLGGYYGVLFFEPVLKNTPTNTTQVSAKIGVLMLANVGVVDPKAKKAEILTFTTGQFHEDGTLPLLLRVKNVSLNFFTAKPSLLVTPLLPFGQATQTVPLEDKIIFPGSVRRWTADAITQTLTPNTYKAVINVSSGNGQIVSRENYFVVFPLRLAIEIILGVLLLSFIIVKRKRFKEAIKALFRP